MQKYELISKLESTLLTIILTILFLLWLNILYSKDTFQNCIDYLCTSYVLIFIFKFNSLPSVTSFALENGEFTFKESNNPQK